MKITLDIPPGIFADDTAFAGSNRWIDGSNVRFWRGKAEVIGGWEMANADAVTGVCRTIFPWTDVAAVLNIALGTNSRLHVINGGQMFNITPSSGFTAGAENGTGGAGYGTGTYGTGEYSEPSTSAYFPLTWSLSAFGQQLIANPRGQGIFRWQNNTAVVAALLAGAPASVSYTLVTPNRQIMALGCNEETLGGFNPLCVRWCDIEDPTDWTTTATNNAGEYILTGGGRLVGGVVVGQYEIIWTDSAVYLVSFLGDPGQTYSFQKMGDRCGLVGPNAMAVIQGVAYWISPDLQFWAMPPGGAPQIIPCPVRDDFVENLAASQSDKIVASTNATFGEVRFDYPDSRDDAANPDNPGVENSRYLAMSVLDGSWYRGVMTRTAMVDAGPTPNPLGVDYSGAIYYHERGNSANGDVLSWHVETADQYIGSGEPIVMIKGMYPDFQDQQGAVFMTITTRLYPQGTDYVRGPYSLNPGRSQRTFQASGRIARIKFVGSSSPSFVRFGNPVFDAIPTSMQ